MRSEKKYNIVPSNNPDKEGTHIILMTSTSKHGCNCGRVFKGNLEECKKKIKKN